MDEPSLAYLIDARGMVDRATPTYGDPRVQEIVQELGSRFAAMADERGLSDEEALAAAAGVVVAVATTVHDHAGCDLKAFRSAFFAMVERGLENVPQ